MASSLAHRRRLGIAGMAASTSAKKLSELPEALLRVFVKVCHKSGLISTRPRAEKPSSLLSMAACESEARLFCASRTSYRGRRRRP